MKKKNQQAFVLKHRNTVRLPAIDYTQPGGYFVTLVCHHRRCFFGEINDTDIKLNSLGKLVTEEWQRTSEIRPYVELDSFIIMPNHLHGILMILYESVGTTRQRRSCPKGTLRVSRWVARLSRSSIMHIPKGPVSGSLGAIIGQFKAVVTKRAIREGIFSGEHLWQRNYYEHIIRDEDDLHRIREYILYNPRRWAEDEENPEVYS